VVVDFRGDRSMDHRAKYQLRDFLTGPHGNSLSRINEIENVSDFPPFVPMFFCRIHHQIPGTEPRVRAFELACLRRNNPSRCAKQVFFRRSLEQNVVHSRRHSITFMNPIHLHLLTNHIPVIATLIGALLLVAGLIRKSRELRIAAAAVLLVAAIGGMVASASGEEADELVEHREDFDKALIHDHEEAAERTMPFVFAMGLLALATIGAEMARKRFGKFTAPLLLVAALGVFGFAAWAGFLGGKIRHPEIHGLSLPVTGGGNVHSPQTANEVGESEDDD